MWIKEVNVAYLHLYIITHMPWCNAYLLVTFLDIVYKYFLTALRKGSGKHQEFQLRPQFQPSVTGFITVTSLLARWCLKSPASRLFTEPLIQVQIKENFKALRHWPLCGEFTCNRWIPCTNGQERGKCFHLMMSSSVFTLPIWVDRHNYPWICCGCSCFWTFISFQKWSSLWDISCCLCNVMQTLAQLI